MNHGVAYIVLIPSVVFLAVYGLFADADLRNSVTVMMSTVQALVRFTSPINFPQSAEMGVTALTAARFSRSYTSRQPLNRSCKTATVYSDIRLGLTTV